MGLVGSVRAAGLVTSLAPMMRATSVCGEVAVDLVHVEELVVGDVGFGEEHVHVAGHSSGDGMDAEVDVDAALGERIVEFADFVLRLRDGHAVAGDDDDFAGGAEDAGGFFGGGAADGRCFFRAGGGSLDLAEAAEEDVGEGAVHRLRHDDREDEAGRAVERAGDDEQLAVEDKAHRRGGESGVGIQQRDDGGHVGAADGDDEHHAEDERNADHEREEADLIGMKHEDYGDDERDARKAGR